MLQVRKQLVRIFPPLVCCGWKSHSQSTALWVYSWDNKQMLIIIHLYIKHHILSWIVKIHIRSLRSGNQIFLSSSYIWLRSLRVFCIILAHCYFIQIQDNVISTKMNTFHTSWKLSFFFSYSHHNLPSGNAHNLLLPQGRKFLFILKCVAYKLIVISFYRATLWHGLAVWELAQGWWHGVWGGRLLYSIRSHHPKQKWHELAMSWVSCILIHVLYIVDKLLK